MIGGQKQEAGNDSINVQANTVNFSGLSFHETKELALLVFKDNFLVFQQEAKFVAEERATQITEKFLKDISTNQPELLDRIKDPAVANATFNAQKAYALNGEPDLENLLIDLLKKRYREATRNRRLIAIDNAITTAPLLTQSQISLLSLSFLVCYVSCNPINHEWFFNFLENNHLRALSKIQVEDIELDISHLEYLNCLRTSLGKRNTADAFKNYSGLFSKGFAPKSLLEVTQQPSQAYAIPCLNNGDLLQLKWLNEEINKTEIQKLGLDTDIEEKLLQLSRTVEMNFEEICSFLEARNKQFSDVFQTIFQTGLTSINLTPLGLTLAHADCRLNANWETPLSVWVK